MVSLSNADYERNYYEANGVDAVTPSSATTRERRNASGVYFMVGTGQLTIAAAGNIRVALKNNEASRSLYLERVASFSTVAGFGSIFIAPTAGVPVTADSQVTMGLLTAAPVAVSLKGDTNTLTALSGGTQSSLMLELAANVRTEYNLAPLVIPPGYTLGINVPLTAAGTVVCTAYGWVQ